MKAWNENVEGAREWECGERAEGRGRVEGEEH